MMTCKALGAHIALTGGYTTLLYSRIPRSVLMLQSTVIAVSGLIQINRQKTMHRKYDFMLLYMTPIILISGTCYYARVNWKITACAIEFFIFHHFSLTGEINYTDCFNSILTKVRSLFTNSKKASMEDWLEPSNHPSYKMRFSIFNPGWHWDVNYFFYLKRNHGASEANEYFNQRCRGYEEKREAFFIAMQAFKSKDFKTGVQYLIRDIQCHKEESAKIISARGEGLYHSKISSSFLKEHLKQVPEDCQQIYKKICEYIVSLERKKE